MPERRNIVIAGAGIAGLTLATRLAAAGHKPVVVEKESVPGGLSRSFTYDGGYVFDAGPHRFYTDVPNVLSFIHEVLQEDYLTIRRNSGVYMFDRYFEWPLKSLDLFKMPIRVFLAAALDLLRQRPSSGESFEEYILSSYGRTLYEIFFKPYTEKFLGLPCSAISKDWAVTGIDRAVIDNSIKVNNLFALATSLLNPQPPLDFIYPKSGGIGVFSEKMTRMVEAGGGRVLFGSGITAVETRDGAVKRVMIGTTPLDCDLLVWTAPLPELATMLGIECPPLDYLGLLLYNYILDAEISPSYQWCYFGAQDTPFNRISFPGVFNPALVPSGTTSMCVEVTCRKGDERWQHPETIDPWIRTSMAQKGIIAREGQIAACHIEKVGNAYPVYSLGYRDRLSHAESELKRISGLELLGRTGRFWYNNMDHSIEAALELAGRIGSTTVADD